tara:strand:- start:3294 stop:3638 length:345 start_codon:yes stop_codon:yes gene_type:complete
MNVPIYILVFNIIVFHFSRKNRSVWKKTFGSKKLFKLREGFCKVCGEDRYELLDAHRIVEGSKGGKYDVNNCVCLCTSCHRLQHAGTIKILGWVHSTKGNLLHYIDKNGEEQFS